MSGTGSVSAALVAFAAVAALLTITPGIDTILVIRSTVLSGRRTGYVTGVGVCSGLLVWGVVSALGVTAVLSASRVAFDVLRLGGAVYLVGLGLQALWRSRLSDHAQPASGAAQAVTTRPITARSGFRRGVLTNLLNPKVGVFYLTLLPQLIPAGAAVLPLSLAMAAIHAAEGALWFAVVVLLVGRLRPWLESPRVVRGLERVVGIVFLGFGVRLATERI